jgi:maleate isomerase
VLEALARAGAPQALTTAGAIERALAALGARRIGLITPYSAETTAHEAAYLRAAGFDMVHAQGFALGGSDAFCATPSEFWRQKVLEAARPDIDAWLVSCANISVFGVIDELEQRLERPVVTSNQAVLWDAVCRVDVRDRAPIPGRLAELSITGPPTRLTSPARPRASGDPGATRAAASSSGSPT